MNLSLLLMSDIIVLFLNKKKLTKLYEYLKLKKKNKYPILHLLKHAKKKTFIYSGKKILDFRETSLQ